jgi:hypothetical protein
MSGHEADPLRLLRETVVSGEDSGVARRRGESVSREMAAAIRAVPERRRAARTRLAAAGASVMVLAGVCAATTIWTRKPPSMAAATSISAASSLVPPAAGTAALMPGDEVVIRDGAKKTFDLPGGATVAMSPASRLRWLSEPGVAAADLRLALAEGRVDLRVPPSSRGGSLVVVTPHAELVVHGTVLTVEVMRVPDRGDGTCVAVAEGLVTVRSRGAEAKLAQGGTWSSFVDRSLCGSGFAAERSAPAPGHGAPPARARRPRAPASLSPPSRPFVASTLALENRVFQSAALAHQRGDDAEAIRLFDELVHTYPDSPLVPEALERRRRAAERLEAGR